MAQKLIETVARSTRLKALNHLKRTQGLSVTDLAERLKMSYMGAKDICLDLEKHGLLSARREPKPAGTTGRPCLIYRLTDKAKELFPKASNALTLELLEAVQRLQGYAAAEKLLMQTWQQRVSRYVDKLKQPTIRERATALTKMRDAEGHMAELSEAETGLVIIEHHSPFADVMQAYPLVARLEVELFRKVLGVPVERDDEQNAGLQRVSYKIPLQRSEAGHSTQDAKTPVASKPLPTPKPVQPALPAATKPAPAPEPVKPAPLVQKPVSEPAPVSAPVSPSAHPAKPAPSAEAADSAEAPAKKAKPKKTKTKSPDPHGYFDF